MAGLSCLARPYRPGLLSAPDGWNVEQIRQFQEWFDSVLAGNTASRTRLIWAPGGSKYQAFSEAPYKDEFDEWLARIVCYAFSLPPTAFTKQVNRATAETSQQAALDEGMAPLMGWVKRLADHVIQVRLGEPDLEFVWAEGRPADPAQEAKIIDTYVRNGVYAINEARDLLGLDPVAGGDRPMVYGTQGAVPLGASAADGAPRLSDAVALANAVALRKYNPDWESEPRVPPHNPGPGEWTTGTGDTQVAAAGDLECEGLTYGGCESGGSRGTTAMYRVFGRNLCVDCAGKSMGLDNKSGTVKARELRPYLIKPDQ